MSKPFATNTENYLLMILFQGLKPRPNQLWKKPSPLGQAINLRDRIQFSEEFMENGS